MVTAITYHCEIASLGDVDQTEFAEAFENEVRVNPKYREYCIFSRIASSSPMSASQSSDPNSK